MDFQLQQEVEDRHLWRLSSKGQYKAKLAYEGFFLGSTLFDHGKGSGNHGHHPNVTSLCGWSRTISAGRLIAWHVMGYLIRISLSIVYPQENFNLICSDRSVFRACPLSLQSYPSMIGGRKLAAAPLMSWWGKELIRLLYLELGLYGTITMGVFWWSSSKLSWCFDRSWWGAPLVVYCRGSRAIILDCPPPR
jgi:hypothetical protein